MATVLRMPKLGFSMTEGKIIQWVKKEGEKVAAGEIVLVIETDKVNYDIEAPGPGNLAKILVNPGDVIPVSGPMAVITQGGESVPPEFLAVKKEAIGKTAPEAKTPASPPAEENPEEIKASPLAKKMAMEQGIDLRQVPGTGPGGRIKKEDVEQFIAERGKIAEAPPPPLALSPAPEGKAVKMSSLRATIAKRLTGSYQQAPHIFLFSQIQMAQVQSILKQINEEGNVKLSATDFLIKTCALSLAQFGNLNTSLQGDEIIVYSDINISLAVSIEDGLIVPVLRNPHTMTLREIASLRETLITKAREGKLKLDDLEGGTFTISNLGMYGIDFFTSIINPPQCAILSVGEIRKTPIVVGEEDEIKIVPVMKVGLSIDHRIVDGAYGARFLEDLRTTLEKPYLML